MLRNSRSIFDMVMKAPNSNISMNEPTKTHGTKRNLQRIPKMKHLLFAALLISVAFSTWRIGTAFESFLSQKSETKVDNNKVQIETKDGEDGGSEKDNKEMPMKKLGDGCYHVFLDVGANIGIHGRWVLEPAKYPNNKNRTKEIFAQHFGDPEVRDPRDVCVFAFEPNPAHHKRHLELQEAYGKVGIKYHPIPNGVSDQDGNITFYHQDNGGHNEWAFSSINWKGRYLPNTTSETVPVIRLSKWLMEHLYERNIPENTRGGLDIPSRVVMKMDVEGMEIIMLPDLLLSGALCKTVDFIFTEYHTYGFPVKPDAVTGRGGLPKKNGRDAEAYVNTLIEATHSLRNDDCKLRTIELADDESYLFDEQPLPPASAWW